ncbi:MAG: hypothetical protein KF686_03480 [Ramlibacter sp.]|nr:hypothetical protein [Ramlibacter sp.]
MCDCCDVARVVNGFRQFSPDCLWCGARYLKAVKTVASGKALETWRESIISTWEAYGHTRERLRELARPAGVPLAPMAGKVG